MAYCAVIVAAGRSARIGGGTPKQFTSLCGRGVVWHAVQPFLQNRHIKTVRVIVAAEDKDIAAQFFADNAAVDILPVGGKTRAQSVRNGIHGLADDDWAVVHDAARPCLTDAALTRLLQKAGSDDIGGLLALPLADCLKNGGNGRVRQTLQRTDKWLAQTPQMFRVGLLRASLADEDSDESQAVERAGHLPLLVAGETTNIKITGPDDFALATAILTVRQSKP
ncbi:MAG: 2-C-methyl-D-erythritol 4-phosphate cytidylyltransferase [Gammaproteobacteria bacterium]